MSVRGLPYRLSSHDPISIGSDRGCTIVISDADAHHAELRWNPDEEAWFVYDDPAPKPIVVNGMNVESFRLREGDWFDIAGVRIRFSGGWLKELDPDKPVGLRVTLRHVSATAGGKRRLDDVSFQAEEGAFVALLGPSGCGKSTLIQRIAGLAPFEGEIRFNGHDLREEKDSLLPLVAYLPQAVEDTLHGDMTVREAMEDFARVHLAADARPDFQARLRDVGLDGADVPAKAVHQLSGGQKRRFALALALLRDPQLLLLDEPTAGLDPAAEAGVMELLERLAEQGRTVLCATHVLGSLDRCDEVLVLAPGGSVACSGTPCDALAHFGASDWLSVYRTLESGRRERADKPVPSDPEPRKLPDSPPAASFGGAFRATLVRLVRSVSSKRNRLLFFGNPVGVALVLAFACGSMFKDGGDKETVCFCMAVAMFWLGLTGTVRNLVSERVPKRCLDRMRGMPLVRYFWAHVAFAALAAAVQSLLFVFPVFLVQHNKSVEFSSFAMPAFWFWLSLVAFAGGCVGLAVSAAAKKEIQAVWALPFVAILALFLSKPVLESKDDKTTGALRAIECAMPTLYTQECLYAELGRFRVSNSDSAELARARWHFIALAVGYPLVFLPLAFFLQKKREEEWDGR